MKDDFSNINKIADVDVVNMNVLPSKNEIIRGVTISFCANMDRDQPYDLGELGSSLLQLTNDAIEHENAYRKSIQVGLLSKNQRLTHSQIADLIMSTRYVKKINCSGGQNDPTGSDDVLGVYMSSGQFSGVYVTDHEEFNRLALEVDYALKEADLKEIYANMEHRAGRVLRTTDPDLVAVNNGIFDYKSKTLQPFDPSCIFLSKVATDYNPSACPVYISEPDGSIWDVDSWMNSLSSDPAIVAFLWQILSAVIRPFVNWGTMIWFYAESGNNGKGTLMQLMRNLLGSAAISVTLSQFSDRFGLGHLIGKTAVLADEINAGDKLNKLANLKAAITSDLMQIEQKFKNIIEYRFHGLLVFCVNDRPQIIDKSGSFARRLTIVPFGQCFTGREKKYIKHDFLARKDVLEYVLFKILNTDFYEFDIPEACINAREEFLDFNDPIREFCKEILPLISWQFAPFQFLYDLYRAWFRKTQPVGFIEGKGRFDMKIKTIVNELDVGWEYVQTGPVRAAKYMQGPERLIAEYDLHEWFNKSDVGQDPDLMCQPNLKTVYRGIMRKDANADPVDED